MLNTLRSRLIRLAAENPEFRKEILPIFAGEDEETEAEEVEEAEEAEGSVDKLARNLRLLSPTDRTLAMGLVRLAKEQPAQKKALLDLVSTALAAAASNSGWDGEQIAEGNPGPERSESDESYMSDAFTQGDFSELREQQEGGNMAAPGHFASDQILRRRLIHFASRQPVGSAKRATVLSILAEGCPDNLDEAECAEWEANTEKYGDKFKSAGCEKLPEALRENCEKGPPGAKKDDDEGKKAAVLPSAFEKALMDYGLSPQDIKDVRRDVENKKKKR